MKDIDQKDFAKAISSIRMLLSLAMLVQDIKSITLTTARKKTGGIAQIEIDGPLGFAPPKDMIGMLAKILAGMEASRVKRMTLKPMEDPEIVFKKPKGEKASPEKDVEAEAPDADPIDTAMPEPTDPDTAMPEPAPDADPDAIAVGDIVAYATDEPFRSGASAHPTAVVVSTDPRILVSRDADMRWQSTIIDRKLKVVGKATADELAKCMSRLDG